MRRAGRGRYADRDRDRVIVLLSAKAGLRAGEIAKLTWPMVVDAQGRIASQIELHDAAAKKGSGRTIPMHPDLSRALRRLQPRGVVDGPVIQSERGHAMEVAGAGKWHTNRHTNPATEG